ncbi:MAG: DsbE family thiol:disulfide interchange protein [Beijerinckiaceae bacterium]|jgi:cytochrome c biogenesis protein CcmG, thiol:disulfide interchange protein DsbE|uniref:DsbE family thiol:disulfide interchange protein n=1 Tax=Methylobacterium sp. TaxID=409 RepID=UPI00272506C3|nr:DsbE family thiol:disulfide interchange protein [Methylobacterium sp.]MBX9741101.1 DsbE family thiol:disulfide interchange protein [Beijerinckiaceae bacterium]MDO9425421.1 DsbE family thiol:disulfide interchange protein [Methylobacterium sp.]
MTEAPLAAPRRRIPWLALLPVLVFVALAILFAIRLYSGDPSRLPSALIGKQVPAFRLPPIEGLPGDGFSEADLKGGRVSIVNIFASWCVPCRDEHPFLMKMSQDPKLKDAGVRMFGLNYKDEPKNAREFLAQFGNPYGLTGADRPGRAAIDWGVYGVPETFVVRGDGTIAYKQIGPINDENFRTRIMPAVEAAIAAGAAPAKP